MNARMNYFELGVNDLSSNLNYIWKFYELWIYTHNVFGVVNCIIFFILNKNLI